MSDDEELPSSASASASPQLLSATAARALQQRQGARQRRAPRPAKKAYALLEQPAAWLASAPTWKRVLLSVRGRQLLVYPDTLEVCLQRVDVADVRSVAFDDVRACQFRVSLAAPPAELRLRAPSDAELRAWVACIDRWLDYWRAKALKKPPIDMLLQRLEGESPERPSAPRAAAASAASTPGSGGVVVNSADGVRDLDARELDAKRLAEHVAVLIHVLERGGERKPASGDGDGDAEASGSSGGGEHAQLADVATTVRKISSHYDAELEASREREREATNKLWHAEQRVARLESALERTAKENSELRERAEDLVLSNDALKSQMDELKRFFNDEHDRSLQKRHEDQQKLASLQQTNDDLLQNLIDLKTMWAEQQLDTKRRPRLVIVGGGFTGCYVAKRVERFYDTVLVDSKDYFEFTPSILRVLTEPNHWKAIQIPHARYLDLQCATVLHARATRLVSAHELELSDGRRLAFDRLLLASGSSYAAPIKEPSAARVFFASRGATLAAAHRELRAARHALIIGGGIVAVELAAEIVEHFGDAVHVQLVHSGPRLMSSSRAVPAGAAAYCQRRLEALGVELTLNERIVGSADNGAVFTSRSGAQYRTDLAFVCTGIVPNTELLVDDERFRACLDDKGFAIVDKHLRLQGYEHIYAGGDMVNIREEKLAQTAEFHAQTIVANLLDRSKTPRAEYKSVTRPILISLGRVDGTFLYGDFWLGGIIPALLKEVVEYKVMVAYRWRFPAVFGSKAHDEAAELKKKAAV